MIFVFRFVQLFDFLYRDSFDLVLILLFQDQCLFKVLVIVMVNYLCVIMGELVELVGVSRVILNCYCGICEGFKWCLESYVRSIFECFIYSVVLQWLELWEVLCELIWEYFVQCDLLVLLMFEQNLGCQVGYGDVSWQFYVEVLDVFFLCGQQKCVFCIDISVVIFSEFFIVLIYGMVDVECCGCVVSVGLFVMLEELFLCGVLNFV